MSLSSRLAVLFLLALLGGCATGLQNFTMYPKELRPQDRLADNMAVVLVGITGPAQASYMRFTHSVMPSLNVEFQPRGDSILAFAVPAGIKNMSLSSYIRSRMRAGYLPNGMSFGYVPVHSDRIDIDKPGIYYFVTVDASQPQSYTKGPVAEQLREVRSRLGQVFANREPVNFSWP